VFSRSPFYKWSLLQAHSPTPIVISSGTDNEEAKRKQKKEEEGTSSKDQKKSSQPIPKDPIFKTPDHSSDSDYSKHSESKDEEDEGATKSPKKVTHHIQRAHFGTVYKVKSFDCILFCVNITRKTCTCPSLEMNCIITDAFMPMCDSTLNDFESIYGIEQH